MLFDRSCSSELLDDKSTLINTVTSVLSLTDGLDLLLNPLASIINGKATIRGNWFVIILKTHAYWINDIH
jgi:hypothetical protein